MDATAMCSAVLLRNGVKNRKTVHRNSPCFHRRQPICKKSRGFAELIKEAREEESSRVPLRPHKVSPMRTVPSHIQRPPYADSGKQSKWSDKPQVQETESDREGMRAAGKLAAETLEYASTLVKVGVTTDEIDEKVHEYIISRGAYPSPLNYGKFPKSLCTSVNECICHGIPDSRKLEDGDIVNCDVTVYLNGFHGDTSRTFLVGNVDKDAKKLVKVTKEALDAAIKICKPGVAVKDIGKVINDIADKHGYGVVKNYVGHGVGKEFHSGPAIFHFRNNEPGVLKKYSTFTIEPMLTINGKINERVWADKWTVVTADGALTAQFEHTLMLVDGGVEILTAYE